MTLPYIAPAMQPGNAVLNRPPAERRRVRPLISSGVAQNATGQAQAAEAQRQVGQPMAQFQQAATAQRQGATTAPPDLLTGQPGAAQPAVGALSRFGPGQNLIGTQVGPSTAPDVAAARATTGRLLGSLETAPNRQQLAENLFDTLAERETARTGGRIRELGQRSAALGRLGSGMVTEEAGDIFGERKANLAAIRAGLSSETAGRTLEDYISRLNAAQGVTGQLSDLDRGQREELRGERGYQVGREESATDRAIQQRMLEEQLQEGAFGREQSINQLLAQYGFGDVNPLQTYIAQNYQQQAQQGQEAVGDVLGSLGAEAGSRLSPELEAYLRQQRARQIAGTPTVVE